MSWWARRAGRPGEEARLQAELRDHLEREVAARMRDGASEAEARRAARLELGGLEQVAEACRDVRRTRWLEDLARDLRQGARGLQRTPGFTATVVLTLALGMAASAAIFNLVDSALLRPLPVPDPGSLLFLSEEDGGRGGGPWDAGRLPVVSYPLYRELRADHQGAGKLFAGLAAQQSGHTLSVVSRPGVEHREAAADATGRAVSANFFDVLGVGAHRGRTFLAQDETAPGANPVMVLNHRYWQRRFAGDPGLVGSRLLVNGTSYLVVGVTPPGFAGTNVVNATDFWVPVTMQADLMRGQRWIDDPAQWWLMGIGRLSPGVSPDAAQTGVNLTLRRFLASDPKLMANGATPESIRMVLVPGARGVSIVHREGRVPLLMLMAAVALLLLIVAVNVCHLLVARAGARQRELQIRTALGATRGRLLRQLGAEGLLLSTLGAAAGILLTPLVSEAILSLFPNPGALGMELAVDGRLLGFIGLLALTLALLLGLIPAWQAPAGQRPRPLQATSRGVTLPHSHGLGTRALLVAQVAFSVVLLVGAGLLTRSLRQLREVDRGFDGERLLVAAIHPRMVGIGEEGAATFYDQLLARVAKVPGVTGASVSVHGLLSGSRWHRHIAVAGRNPPAKPIPIATNGVSPGYFATVGMRLVRGRGFTRADQTNAPQVTVINQTLARRLFGDGDPLGRRLELPRKSPVQLEVVGVVRDARTAELDRQPPPMFFTPVVQQDHLAASLEVRTAGDPAALAASIRAALHEAHPGLPVQDLVSMRSQIERSLTGYRLVGTLSTAFGLAALVLVCLGLYGVIAQWSGQRTQEIGVRMALGATEGTVRRLVLRQALPPVLLGLVLGLPAAVGFGQLLGGLLFGVRPTDPATLALAAIALAAAATAAAYLPARRASRAHPMLALRCE